MAWHGVERIGDMVQGSVMSCTVWLGKVRKNMWPENISIIKGKKKV